jgi:cytochrome c oxidase subunit IV
MTTENHLPGLAAFHLRAAAIYAVIGMAFGIYMGIKHDFALAAAHAHWNLLGWLSIAVYGLVLAQFPAIAQSRLAKIQAVIAHLGVLVFPAGIAIAELSDHTNETLVVIGSLLVLLGGLLFVGLIWRATAGRA